MLNKIIHDYGRYKNLGAFHSDYVTSWKIAEYVPWLITRVNELSAREKRLTVELDAAHAALRALLGAIPGCECDGVYDCTHCALEHEIGIAKNLLGGTISYDEYEVASVGYEVDREGANND